VKGKSEGAESGPLNPRNFVRVLSWKKVQHSLSDRAHSRATVAKPKYERKTKQSRRSRGIDDFNSPLSTKDIFDSPLSLPTTVNLRRREFGFPFLLL